MVDRNRFRRDRPVPPSSRAMWVRVILLLAVLTAVVIFQRTVGDSSQGLGCLGLFGSPR